MAVASVGTPTITRATTGSVTGTWGTGQTRTAGNLLVAVVTAGATSGCGQITCTLAGKWATATWAGNSTDTSGAAAFAEVAAFFCTAWGSDAAPIFTSTLTGTGAMTVTLFELSGATLLSFPFDTLGWYQSGGSAGTLTSMAATTNAAVSASGGYAIACYAQEAAAATNTWNAGSGWSNVATDGATSSVLHTAVDILASPPSGSTLAEPTPHWTTNTSAYGAGMTLVIAPPVVSTGGITLFMNYPSATVTSGGTTAVASGTTQTWTVSPAAAFPAVSSSLMAQTQFHCADPAAPSELIEVISAPGGTSAGQTWTVTRGAENSTPVAHASNFTVFMVASAGDLGGFLSAYNVRAQPFGAAGDGVTDDYAAIQGALNAAYSNGGGMVFFPPGVYRTTQTLQVGSNTMMAGAGMGVSTIRQSSSFNPPHIANNQGLNLLITRGNEGGINIAIRDLTFDGNEAGTPSIPGGFSSVQSYNMYLEGITKLQVSGVEVINSIGYAMLVQNCLNFIVQNCRITQGQDNLGYNQQDGIHVTGSRFGVIAGNNIDTGTVNLVGDDCIACQSVSPDKPCTDITITGNVMRSATRGISVVLGGGPCSNITIAGNDIWASINDGIILSYTTAGSGIAQNVTVTGNTLANVAQSGVDCGINLQDVFSGTGSGSGQGWQDVTISGNLFLNMISPSGFGITSATGNGLVISGNNFDGVNLLAAMQIGNNVSATSEPTTNFDISGNVINMTNSTGANSHAINITDSAVGSVSNNTIIGPGTGISGSCAVYLAGVSASNLVTGVNVVNNRISAWQYGIYDFQSGGTAPDYNVYLDNNLHGSTNPLTVLGAHTLYQPPVIDIGGIADSEQFISLTTTYTLTSTTALQKLFNSSTNGALTVAASTSYFFECYFDLSSMSTASNAFSFGFGGTAAFTSLKYAAWAQRSSSLTTPVAPTVVTGTAAGAQALVAAATTGATGTALIKGIVRISTGGTLIPEVALGVATSTAVVGTNSFFRCWPAGSNTVLSAGNWS